MTCNKSLGHHVLSCDACTFILCMLTNCVHLDTNFAEVWHTVVVSSFRTQSHFVYLHLWYGSFSEPYRKISSHDDHVSASPFSTSSFPLPSHYARGQPNGSPRHLQHTPLCHQRFTAYFRPELPRWIKNGGQYQILISNQPSHHFHVCVCAKIRVCVHVCAQGVTAELKSGCIELTDVLFQIYWAVFVYLRT